MDGVAKHTLMAPISRATGNKIFPVVEVFSFRKMEVDTRESSKIRYVMAMASTFPEISVSCMKVNSKITLRMDLAWSYNKASSSTQAILRMGSKMESEL